VFSEDYVIRMIEQLGAFVAQIAGLNEKGEHDQALDAADQAWGKLIDAPRALIDAVDTPTLAGMLREPAKIRAAAQLLYEEGRALAGNGDPLHAQVRYRRALELMLELRTIDPSKPLPQDEATRRELWGLVPAHMLDPRYQSYQAHAAPG
jgi:hypothetical protein